MPGGRTAILFFTHRPEREWKNKQFVRDDYAKHRRVAQAFYEHSRQAVVESDLPVVEVNRAQQRGGSFGARLSNAFADAFARGYDHVIAVGSDCPRLHEVDWTTVAEDLEDGVPVLGPTPHQSGAYLIGIPRAQFEREAFAALPWKTSALFSALADHLTDAAGTAPARLAPRGDINNHDDLVACLRGDDLLPSSLRGRLRTVLGAARPEKRTRGSRSRRFVTREQPRAPPTLRVPLRP